MRSRSRVRWLSSVICGLLLAAVAAAAPKAPAHRPANTDPSTTIHQLADRYYAAMLALKPMEAMDLGVMPRHHDRLDDIRPQSLRSLEKRQDEWLRTLQAIDVRSLGYGPDWVTYGLIREDLESAVQARVCHLEWWYSVNQMGSWHLQLAHIAELQPVGTETERREALARWRSVPDYIEAEISNLRTGLAHGYTVPQPVAKRMLIQIDGLIAAPLPDHPYANPAARSKDATFGTAFRAVITDSVLPALRKYRQFLANEYLPKARTSLAVTELPDGTACYAALLRVSTTLSRSADEVYARGKATVDRYRAEVLATGQKLFGTQDYATIIQRARSAPDNQFKDRSELLPASRAYEERAHAKIRPLFGFIPDQPLTVEPIPAYEDSAGASSHYEPPSEDGHPGVYRISLMERDATRASAQVTAYHEGWPGHHLQIAYAQRLKDLHPVAKLLANSGYVEGWARYAEALAEEVGLYDSDYAKILRRAWPARGMVVDPGIHAFHWTREQAVAFVQESGRFVGSSAEDLVDRIAAIPGQLTAYDSGAAEFFELRRQAESNAQGHFDLRAFHDAALGSGTVTLPMLHARVKAWIAEQVGKTAQ